MDRLLGTIQIESHVVMLANTAPWDSAPCGRLHTIVRHTPAVQRGRVGDFLKCYNPVSGVVGEIRVGRLRRGGWALLHGGGPAGCAGAFLSSSGDRVSLCHFQEKMLRK